MARDVQKVGGRSSLTTVVLMLVGGLAALVAVVYSIDAASVLPAFLPGHRAGSGRHRVDVALVATSIALAAFAAASLTAGRADPWRPPAPRR